jgi:hypothetical protein
MRKLLILLFFVACTAKGGISQNLHFVPHWKTNDAFKYYYFNNKYHPKDSSYKQDTDTTIALFKVLAASAKGYEVELKYDYSKNLPPLFPAEGIKKIVKEVKTSPIILVLDTSGKYTGIKNWQDLKKKCLAKVAVEKKNAKAEDKETWDYWGTKFETQEQIEKYFGEDIEFFFMLYGSQLRRNRTFEYEDEIKNPYGDEYLPASTSLEAKDDTQDPKMVEVKLFTLPNADSDEIKAIRTLIKSQTENPSLYTDADLFDLQDYYVFVNNTQTGTHQMAMYVRYLKEGPKELVESYKFILAY